MADNTYDELARVLREMHGRFGAEAFSNRRRLTGLMADRLPDAKLEIRVVLDAIDDGVATELAATAPDQLGVQIDRLGARQESRRGIRADIARAAVCACAYGLGLGPLPSQFQNASRTATTPSAPPPRDDDWVGSTVLAGGPAAGAPTTAPAATSPAAVPQPAPAANKTEIFSGSPLVRYGVTIAVAAVAVTLAVRQFGSDDGPARGGDAPTPTPPHVQDPPPPAPAPAPAPAPMPAPVPPPIPTPPPVQPPAPAPVVTPKPRVPQGGFAEEQRDYGVRPTSTLQSNVSSSTPVSIPGARVISTVELMQALAANPSILLFDVLSNPHQESLPGARNAQGAGSPGQFNDNLQWQLSNALQNVTGGRRDAPMVFFCSGPGCWMSYNASLRAAAAGYQNVLWYRGGIAAWRAAGQPLAPLSP